LLGVSPPGGRQGRLFSVASRHAIVQDHVEQGFVDTDLPVKDTALPVIIDEAKLAESVS
jgi:hypothetical protein